MSICSWCGKETLVNSRTCLYCGQPFDAYTPDGAEPGAAEGQRADDWSEHEDAHRERTDGADAGTSESANVPISTSGVLAPEVMAPARLIVRVAPDASTAGIRLHEGQEVVLDGREVRIGRAPSCDITLNSDALVSRHHALLKYEAGVYTIVDLGSSNGTSINEQEIDEEVVLHDGDRIRIGTYELVISNDPASPQAVHINQRMAEPLPRASVESTDPGLVAAGQQQPATGGISSMVEIAVGNNHGAPPPLAGDTTTDAVGSRGFLDTSDKAGQPNSDLALATLQEQLSTIAMAMRQRAEEQVREVERLRAALAEVRQVLCGDDFERLVRAGAAYTDPVELIEVAQLAAENSWHLEHVTRLAARASEIVESLEILRGVKLSALTATVAALRMRLDDMLV